MISSLIENIIGFIIDIFIVGTGELLLRMMGVRNPSKHDSWCTVAGALFWIIIFVVATIFYFR